LAQFYLSRFFEHHHHLLHHSINIHKHIILDIHLLAFLIRFMELNHFRLNFIQVLFFPQLIQKFIVKPIQVLTLMTIHLYFHQFFKLASQSLLFIFSQKIIFQLKWDQNQESNFLAKIYWFGFNHFHPNKIKLLCINMCIYTQFRSNSENSC